MEKLEEEGYYWENFLQDIMKFFFETRKYIANLLNNTKGQEKFIVSMAHINVGLMRKEIKKTVEDKEVGFDIEQYIKLYCYGAAWLIDEWITTGYPMSPSQMAEVCNNSLPAPLLPYMKTR